MAPPRKKPAASKGPGLLPLAGGLVVLLAVIAFFATRDSGDQTSGVRQTRPVEIEGRALPEFPGRQADPAAGMAAPEIAGQSFDGAGLAIRAGGDPKLVIFLAHWCPHCQREVPRLVQWLQDQGEPEGLQLIAVATATDGNRPNYPPSEWLEDEDFDIPTIADDARGSAAASMGLTSYPFFVLLDAENRVLARDSGELTVAQLNALVATARSATTGPPAPAP